MPIDDFPSEDATEQPLSTGAPVTILSVPAGMADGLPPEEASFVRTASGREAVVDEIATDGSIVIELTDDATGIVHFLKLASSDVTRGHAR